MKNKKTYYLLILDRSGSMNDCVNETISGYNEQLQMIRDLQQRHQDQEFYVSLTTFNHMVEHPFLECESKNLKALSTASYIPDGMTALLDAVGESVMNLKARKATEFQQDEATAVVVIMTDGHENASRIFSKQAIRTMIRELEATSNWTFSFMGTTLDAIDVAAGMNIRRENALHFNKGDMKSTMHRIANEFEDYAQEKSKGNKVTDFLKENRTDKAE
jgi:protein-tyrosine-phosphatase